MNLNTVLKRYKIKSKLLFFQLLSLLTRCPALLHSPTPTGACTAFKRLDRETFGNDEREFDPPLLINKFFCNGGGVSL